MSASPLPASVVDWQSRGRFLRLSGMNVFVIDVGGAGGAGGREDGCPLLLLHGFPTSSSDFRHVLPFLRERHRVVLLDFIGFGLSDKPADFSYSLLEQADVVVLALRQLGVRAVHLVAHDMGTSVACELLARRERGLIPFEIRSLCLMNGSVHIEMAHLTPGQKVLRSPLGPLLSRLGSRAFFTMQMRGILRRNITQPDLDEMWAQLCHLDGRLRLPRSIGYIEERRRFCSRWTSALKWLDLPALILWGAADPVAVVAIAERLADEIEGARLVRLEGVGHYPQIEDPAAVASAILSFLDSADPPARDDQAGASTPAR